MRAWALALALAGCSFQAAPADNPGGDNGTGRTGSDASLEPPLDGKAAATCVGTFVDVCVDPPQADVALAQDIDTSTSPLCGGYKSAPAVDACVISGRNITIASGVTVHATGTKKLILIAADSITISGTLDAASHRGKPGGPGADAGPCPTTGFTNPSAAQGGGFGGTFGTSGGNGGNGGDGQFGSIGGVAASAFATTTLRGGCAGSDGRGGSGGRGRGGGAVLLLAINTITVDGTVNASGAGGDGGTTGGAGGGGGSGGMLVIEGHTVKLPGQCFANGGGGGGGAGLSAAAGKESTAPGTVGGGGGHSGNGGDGGDGAFSTTQSKPGNNGSGGGLASGGGGAGGGGAGMIKIIAIDQADTDDSSHVSPPKS